MFNISEITLMIMGFLTALFITNYGIPIILRVCRLKNLYDVHNGRAAHKGSIPTLGGVGIFLGLIMSILIFSNFKTEYSVLANNSELQYIVVAIIIVFFIGLKDDILVISPIKKIIAQFVSAFLLSFPEFGNIRLTNLHGFLGFYEINVWFSVLLTIFVIIVVINGFNLIDGIDGLSSGIGIVTLSTIGIWMYLVEDYFWALLAFSTVGALFAFFRFNVFSKDNKIFMGDTGSLILGIVASILIIVFNEKNIIGSGIPNKYLIENAPVVSFSIFIVPLFDTLRVFSIRLIKHKSPFKPDKNHVHHRLLTLRKSHIQASLIIIAVNVLFIFLGFHISSKLENMFVFGVVIILIASIFSVIPAILINKKIHEVNNERHNLVD